MAKEKNDRVSAVLGGKKSSKKPAKKKGKKNVKGMHVRKADSGGYIAKHDSGPDGEMGQEHVLPDIDALKQHMEDHMGEEEEEEAKEGSSAPAPSPAVV